MLCFGDRKNAAQQRYLRGGLGVMISYFGFFFGSAGMAHRFHPQGWHLSLAALLPSLSIVGMFYITARYLREEKDEYQRDMVVRCLLWGIAAVMTVEMFTSFRRTFGWTGSLPPFTDWFVLCGSVLIAKFSYKFTNRIADDE
ncbi:hypothetical protein [Terriglobus aquaticus]|uniref:Uncharacterized protein n=1 Tax=Terriglobus aquaticus TaxID=940139 RepID=A0ABW9KQ64_9BACT|nr:hypothetical protein [Terriglobus aquaticus]